MPNSVKRESLGSEVIFFGPVPDEEFRGRALLDRDNIIRVLPRC